MSEATEPTEPKGGDKKRTEILLRSLRLDSLADQLPSNVFAVQVKVSLDRSSSADTCLIDSENEPMAPPKYPVVVKTPRTTPYIPQKTVYFANPVEHPNKGQDPWRFKEFATRMEQIKTRAQHEDSSAPERMYLNDLRLVEVPEEHVRENSDGYYVSHKAYQDRARAVIADFQKRSKIHDEEVRDQLGAATPGRVLKPMKLTDVTEVHLKQHMGSSTTTGVQTKRMYFSDGQAEQYNNLKLAPRTPMNFNQWGYIEKNMPGLSSTDFLSAVTFYGYDQTGTDFVETDAKIHERNAGNEE